MTAIIVSLAFASDAIAQPAPNARPVGGVIFGGSAAISQSPAQTTVTQASQRAVIDWHSFNVGSQETVTIQAPNAAAITYLRVIGPNPCRIAGRVKSNGQVVLASRSGVRLYKGAQVNVRSLVLSAPAAADANVGKFINGGPLIFSLPSGPDVAIVNQGDITTADAGMITMLGPSVQNAGTITARLGQVSLLGGTTGTITVSGDGLLAAGLTGAVKQAPSGSTALVTQSGQITAAGGTVRLGARALDGIVHTLISNSGTISAPTIGGHRGEMVGIANGGSISASGVIETKGIASGTRGGQVELLSSSNDVDLRSGAILDASGGLGGGTVALGTTLKRANGGPSVTSKSTSKDVTVSAGAKVSANATSNGNGGRISILSTTTTTLAGDAAAEGGPLGGNGGFIEISGTTLRLTGNLDVSAPNGTGGTSLLDPKRRIL